MWIARGFHKYPFQFWYYHIPLLLVIIIFYSILIPSFRNIAILLLLLLLSYKNSYCGEGEIAQWQNNANEGYCYDMLINHFVWQELLIFWKIYDDHKGLATNAEGKTILPSDNLRTFSTLRTVCCNLESVISNSCPKSSKILKRFKNNM